MIFKGLFVFIEGSPQDGSYSYHVRGLYEEKSKKSQKALMRLLGSST